MIEIEPGIAEAPVERVVLVAKFPGGDRSGNLAQRFRIESKSLTHFASRHAIAISDDIGSHGRVAFAIEPVEVLDNFFSLVAAGKIKIDIRPLAALFRKKTFEEKLHSDGIDGGNAQRITDGTIGGRSAALYQNVLFTAET